MTSEYAALFAHLDGQQVRLATIGEMIKQKMPPNSSKAQRKKILDALAAEGVLEKISSNPHAVFVRNATRTAPNAAAPRAVAVPPPPVAQAPVVVPPFIPVTAPAPVQTAPQRNTSAPALRQALPGLPSAVGSWATTLDYLTNKKAMTAAGLLDWSRPSAQSVVQPVKATTSRIAPVIAVQPLPYENSDPQRVRPIATTVGGGPSSKDVLLNTGLPFVMVCVGKQGSGKSNSMNVVLEQHLLASHNDPARPFTSVVFHRDSSYGCEVLGLCENPDVHRSTLVFTSPTNRNRFRYYADRGFNVQELYFDWQALTAEHLLALLQIDPEDPPLYGATLLAELRQYAKRDLQTLPTMDELVAAFMQNCTLPGQQAAAMQRFNLLEGLVARSTTSTCIDFGKLAGNGKTLLVFDLTDPLMTAADVNSIFYVILSMYRSFNPPVTKQGKIVVFDEAHKFFLDRTSKLCKEIVSCIEVMRHEGTRTLISTQMPGVVPTEVYQLCTFLLVHHLHTPWRDLEKEFNGLTEALFQRVQRFQPGEAVLVAPTIGQPEVVRVAKRRTIDVGDTLVA